MGDALSLHCMCVCVSGPYCIKSVSYVLTVAPVAWPRISVSCRSLMNDTASARHTEMYVDV